MIRGAPVFDALTLGDLTADFKGPGLTLESTAAFVNTATGGTHGWTKNKQWPPAVVAKLNELRAAMEEHLATIHLNADGAPGIAFATARAAPVAPAAPPGGIGEYVGEDPPSI